MRRIAHSSKARDEKGASGHAKSARTVENTYKRQGKMRIAVLVTVLLLSSSCTSTIDKNLAEDVKSDTKAIRSEAGAILNETQKIDNVAKSEAILPKISPHTGAIRSSVKIQKTKLDNVRSKANEYAKVQNKLAQVRKEKRKLEQERDKIKGWVFTVVKVLGLVAVGIGTVIAVRMNMATGITIAIAGIGTTAVTQLWQMYWQWIVGGLGVLLIGALTYVLYVAITTQDAWWREKHRVSHKKGHKKAREKAEGA